MRLRAILAPTLQIDYTSVMSSGKAWDKMPASQFVSMISGPTKLGNALVATQHLLSGSTWQRESDTEIISTHQLRSAHQRYKLEEDRKPTKKVVAKGHGHAVVKHFYKKGEN